MQSNFNKFCGCDLDLNNPDPELLKKLSIEPWQTLDESSSTDAYAGYKKLYMKILVKYSIIESQREKYWKSMQDLSARLDIDLIIAMNKEITINDGKENTENSEETKEEIKMDTNESIKKLELDDPKLLNYLALDPIKTFEHMDPYQAYRQYAVQYFKCLISQSILDAQREKYFEKMVQLRKTI